MQELYSNADDCLKLARLLKNQLKQKMELYGSIYQEVISGKYHCFKYTSYNDYYAYHNDAISFSFKYCEGGFLRLTIGDCISKRSLGQKLAVLSDFYEVLNPIFGTPTAFYTIKDDDENSINLQWSFANVKEDIQNLKNGTYFDDGETEELIIFDEESKNNEFSFNKTTKQLISQKVGLPFELLPLVDLNIEDFIKYKYHLNVITNKNKNENDLLKRKRTIE